jgi:ElaA protein
VLHAQAHLERWYESFGYHRTGENFDDAGIDHVPMARQPG